MVPQPTTSDPAEASLFEGPCRGGPLDGELAACRFAAGFVLADKPAGAVWIYDRRPDGAFAVRDAGHRRLDPERLIATALGEDFDVIAMRTRTRARTSTGRTSTARTSTGRTSTGRTGATRSSGARTSGGGSGRVSHAGS